ncbi:MAG: CapA family protein [Deltaproteobacteria bacterium]|nr:CapA family protein [Deltaproteobacteria bacterium]
MIKLRKIATPYSIYETTGVILRNVLGMDHRDHGAPLDFLPYMYNMNPIVKADCSIVFLGDIMSVGMHKITVHESIKNFLSGSQYLVANLEATVTHKRRRKGVIFGALQWQNMDTVDVMEDLFPPEATYLSVANNHAGDFEDQHYDESCKLLESRGFHLFGKADRPYVDINTRIRLHAGTIWSNQVSNRVHWLRPGQKINAFGKGLNILFPHWGYELEKYPRQEIVDLAKRLAFRFDAILGHHPHTVQPVTIEHTGDKKYLGAYSLGDFCSDIPLKAYKYGMAVKMKLGETLFGDYVIGNIDWRFLECRRQPDNILSIRLVDSIPYFKH